VKIVEVIPSVARRYGGPQHVIRDLCGSLARRGHEITLVTTDLDGPARLSASDVIDEFGSTVALDVVRTVWPRGYALAPSLRRRLDVAIREADLVHVHCVYQYPSWVACRAARRLDVPYVCHPHGQLTAYHRRRKAWKKRPYEWLIERRNLGGARAVVVMSELERADFEEWLPGCRIVVIPPGLDSALLQADGPAPEFPRSWRVPLGAQVVCFLGRFADKKRLDLLVDAFANLSADLSDLHLVLAGPDDEGIGEGLFARVHERGIRDRVSYVGFLGREEKIALLRGSEVLVLPSEDESFGVAAAEASAIGLPVVVSPDVGVASEIAAAGAGLIAVRDADAIAAAVGRIIEDRELRAEMSAQGRSLARSTFAPDAVAAEVEALYRAVAR
jgi:glycosyltransferase involved in cell wall biosynthesis